MHIECILVVSHTNGIIHSAMKHQSLRRGPITVYNVSSQPCAIHGLRMTCTPDVVLPTISFLILMLILYNVSLFRHRELLTTLSIAGEEDSVMLAQPVSPA